MKFFRIPRNSRGDTIVEVMICLVVLSLTLATVYTLSSNSQQAGTEANQRTEALSVAQSQVEFLSNAKNTDPQFAADYQTNTAFCVGSDGTKYAIGSGSTPCSNYGGTPYNVNVQYSGNVFTVTAKWPSANASGGVAKLNLYYKLPGIYAKAKEVATTATVNGLTATINGTVNPSGNLVTDCYFNYDTTTQYTSATKVECAALPPGNGTTAEPVYANISGLAPGTTYFFQLCATNLVGTSCSDTNGTFTTATAAATVTNSATSIGATAATLNGTINPGGNNVTACFFQYGTTTNYGSQINCSSLPGSGNSPVAVSARPTTLTLGVVYHFRLVSTDSVGNGYGTDVSFVTIGPPTPVTGSANNITYSSATLNGTVNPGGGNVTDCHFNYGTSGSFGSQVACGSLPGGGTSAVAVSSNIGGLSQTTTYYFQLCATNAAGAVCDGTQAFTTSAIPACPSGYSGTYPNCVAPPPPRNYQLAACDTVFYTGCQMYYGVGEHDLSGAWLESIVVYSGTGSVAIWSGNGLTGHCYPEDYGDDRYVDRTPNNMGYSEGNSVMYWDDNAGSANLGYDCLGNSY